MSGRTIVISGRFTGCTFARCSGKNGHLFVAHIYNQRKKTKDKDEKFSDQNIEAENFKADCGGGGPASVVTGFRTEKRLNKKNMYFGYVIGTWLVKDGWKWKWVTIAPDVKTIVTCEDITDKEWVVFPLADDIK